MINLRKIRDWINSRKGAETLTIAAILTAVAVAVWAWGWWTSFDNPVPVERPHSLMWDAVSLHLNESGSDTVRGINFETDNPLIRIAAAIIGAFGPGYRSVVLVQVPILILLILSVAVICWKLGGPFAGAAGAWSTVFAPMSLGLAVHLDDLLALQALLAASVAFMMMSGAKTKALIALPVIALAPFAVACSAYSNGLMFLMTFAFASAGLVLYRWKFVKEKSFPFPLHIIAVAAFLAGIWAAWPIPTGYFAGEAASPEYKQGGILQSPSNLFAYLSLWRKVMVEPRMAMIAVIAIGLAFWGKKASRLVMPLVWLYGPMLILSLISKRHDWYMAAAIPATYCIIGIGIAATPRVIVKVVVTLLFAALLFGGWGLGDERIKEDYGRLYDQFLRKPEPYLVSPEVEPPLLAEVGRIVAAECGQRKLPVVFANGMGINGVDAFFVWKNAPNTPIGDVWWGPMFDPAKSCVVMKVQPLQKYPYDLSLALKEFDSALTKTDPDAYSEISEEAAMRLAKLRVKAGNFKSVRHCQSWTVFVPKWFD